MTQGSGMGKKWGKEVEVEEENEEAGKGRF